MVDKRTQRSRRPGLSLGLSRRPFPGPVLAAGARLLTEQTAVRDALIAGTPVSRDGLGDARAALEDACDAV